MTFNSSVVFPSCPDQRPDPWTRPLVNPLL